MIKIITYIPCYPKVFLYNRSRDVYHRISIENEIIKGFKHVGEPLRKCIIPKFLADLEQEARRWNGAFFIEMASDIVGNASLPFDDFIVSMWAKAPNDRVWNSNLKKILRVRCSSSEEVTFLASCLLEQLQKGTIREYYAKKVMRKRRR